MRETEKHEIVSFKAKIMRIRYQKDLFAICECLTEDDIQSEYCINRPDAATMFAPANLSDGGTSQKQGRKTFIVVGDGTPTKLGKTFTISGYWEYNKKFNNYQLRLTACEDYIGTTKDEIVAYLASSILCGIGEVIAERVYDKFGDTTFDIIDNEPERLMEVSGIKQKKLEKIIASYKKNLALHQLTKILAPHNVPYRAIVRIQKDLGEQAAEKVKENPYILCNIRGFGFITTDKIALQMNENYANSKERIAGSIMFVLGTAEHDGHMFLPLDELAGRCCSEKVLNQPGLSETTREMVKDVVRDILKDKERMLLSSIKLIMQDGSANYAIYLKPNYSAEKLAARNVADYMNEWNNDKIIDWSVPLAQAQKQLGVTLDAGQEEAAIMALQSHISVITGGPGTGKTTLLNSLVQAYKMTFPKNTIALAAPTGRAARRMSEQTGMDASTLHSLMYLRPDDKTDFSEPVTEEMEIEADLLIVDESSMIDGQLFAEIMYRVNPATQILFLGDADQLPSVGAGNVLYELLHCPSIPSARLTKIFRQGSDSYIPHNAAAVRTGHPERIIEDPESFIIIHCDTEEEAAEKMIRLAQNLRADGDKDVQMLCPMRRRGACCINELNPKLQDVLNVPTPKKVEVTIGDITFRTGDRVMQTKNAGVVSNGDLGYIKEITGLGPDEELCIKVQFDTIEEPVEIDRDGAFELEHAYAITIHKSQGGEFDSVIIPLFKSMSFFLRRNLLYTAITRAKKRVFLFCDDDAVRIASKREDTSKRNTLLGALITANSK